MLCVIFITQLHLVLKLSVSLGWLPISFLLFCENRNLSFKDFIYLFLERGEGEEKERERNINVRLPLVCPILGTWPATQACALSGNQMGDTLVLRPVLSTLNHTSQGENRHILYNFCGMWFNKCPPSFTGYKLTYLNSYCITPLNILSAAFWGAFLYILYGSCM